MIKHNEKFEPTIPQLLECIPQFRTKSAALTEGKKYGWNTAIQISKRFEKVWVVGRKDFQDSYEGDLRFECYRFPLLRWDIVDGIKTNQVITCRKHVSDKEVTS